MKTITIRGVELPVIEAIKQAARERAVSMNRYVVDILESAVNMGQSNVRKHHDLDEFFGTWDEEEHSRVQKEAKKQRRIDRELWQ
jgi:Cdc6-like AAA superfamily ATPase